MPSGVGEPGFQVGRGHRWLRSPPQHLDAAVGVVRWNKNINDNNIDEEKAIEKFLCVVPKYTWVALSIETLLDFSELTIKEVTGRLKAVDNYEQLPLSKPVTNRWQASLHWGAVSSRSERRGRPQVLQLQVQQAATSSSRPSRTRQVVVLLMTPTASTRPLMTTPARTAAGRATRPRTAGRQSVAVRHTSASAGGWQGGFVLLLHAREHRDALTSCAGRCRTPPPRRATGPRLPRQWVQRRQDQWLVPRHRHHPPHDRAVEVLLQARLRHSRPTTSLSAATRRWWPLSTPSSKEGCRQSTGQRRWWLPSISSTARPPRPLMARRHTRPSMGASRWWATSASSAVSPSPRSSTTSTSSTTRACQGVFIDYIEGIKAYCILDPTT